MSSSSVSMSGCLISLSSNNVDAGGILSELYGVKAKLSIWQEGWSRDGLVICFDLDGKYVSLYSSICNCFLKGPCLSAKYL